MANFKKQRNRAQAKYFYHYTNLAAVIHLLKNRQITLLDPMNWDDKNDAFFMKTYKKRKKAKTVLALCFAEGSERYHHWKAFCDGSDGISINFEKNQLLSMFGKDTKIEHGYVKYSYIQEMEKSLEGSQLNVSELPFLKRSVYRDEKEYRVIYTDTKGPTKEFKNYDIDLCWIKRIRLSPWIPEPLAESVKEILRSIAGCKRLKIYRSTVIENEKWKDFARRAT